MMSFNGNRPLSIRVPSRTTINTWLVSIRGAQLALMTILGTITRMTILPLHNLWQWEVLAANLDNGDRRPDGPGQGGVRDIHPIQTIHPAPIQVNLITYSPLHCQSTLPLHQSDYHHVAQLCSHLTLDNEVNHMTIATCLNGHLAQGLERRPVSHRSSVNLQNSPFQ